MTTLTYCQGLPTPIDELTLLGLTDFELFLFDYSAIAYPAMIETANHLLCLEGKLDKSKWNTHLQKVYGISKRHAGGIIAHAIGKVASAKECRLNHIKQLESKLKSAKEWVNKAKKKVKLAQKFYAKKDWQHAKTGCIFPLSSSLETRKTNWHQLKFTIHHKQRYIHKLEQQIKMRAMAIKFVNGMVTSSNFEFHILWNLSMVNMLNQKLGILTVILIDCLLLERKHGIFIVKIADG
jgi:hypothetical protein